MGWLIDDFLDNISSKKIYFIVTVCIIGFLIYSNTFTAPFVFDDIGTVYGNNALRQLNLLLELWSPLKPRFLGYLTFLLNYKIAGWNLALYHITNLLLHILTTFFVWRLVLLIFKTPRFKESYISKHKKYIALFCALIFLTHPIQTQAVTYIVQRFTGLAALFYIISQFGILIRYLKLLIIPVGQSIDHYESPVNNIFDPSVIAGITILLLIVILAIITFRKHRLIS